MFKKKSCTQLVHFDCRSTSFGCGIKMIILPSSGQKKHRSMQRVEYNSTLETHLIIISASNLISVFKSEIKASTKCVWSFLSVCYVIIYTCWKFALLPVNSDPQHDALCLEYLNLSWKPSHILFCVTEELEWRCVIGSTLGSTPVIMRCFMWHLLNAIFLNLNINKTALKIIKQHKLEMVNRILKWFIKII